MSNPLRIAIATLALAVLAGCGAKGPLFLPAKQAPAAETVPEPAPAESPVEQPPAEPVVEPAPANPPPPVPHAPG